MTQSQAFFSPGSLIGTTLAFDLDGTLVDTAPDLMGTLNIILGEHGLAPLPLSAARNLIGKGAKALLDRGFAQSGQSLDGEQSDRLFARFLDIYQARIAQESRPFDGMERALDLFAEAGAGLVVCTNKRTDLSLALLGALGLTNRFKAVIGADSAPAPKPDARHYLTAIEAAGGVLERSLMIGDSAADVQAARNAGAPVVVFSFGYTEVPASDLGADVVLDHYDDLPSAVKRLLTRG
jgi:phosphoglycolate phosphatase